MESKARKGEKGEDGNNKRKGGGDQETLLKRKKGFLSKDLRLMMYGYGDDPDPLEETVELLEEILIEYLTDMVHQAQDVAVRRGRMTTEDVLFVVRKDTRKYARVKTLLNMNEELKRARKAFEEADYGDNANEAAAPREGGE